MPKDLSDEMRTYAEGLPAFAKSLAELKLSQERYQAYCRILYEIRVELGPPILAGTSGRERLVAAAVRAKRIEAPWRNMDGSKRDSDRRLTAHTQLLERLFEEWGQLRGRLLRAGITPPQEPDGSDSVEWVLLPPLQAFPSILHHGRAIERLRLRLRALGAACPGRFPQQRRRRADSMKQAAKAENGPRQGVPKSVQTEVLTRSKRRCCICYGLDKDLTFKKGQIAHLDRDRNNNVIHNLAWLCLNHHDEYDRPTRQAKGLTIEEVRKYCADLYRKMRELPASMRKRAPNKRRRTK